MSIKKWLGAFLLIAMVILLSRLDSIIFKVIKSDSPMLKEITIDLANELLFVIAFLMYSNVVPNLKLIFDKIRCVDGLDYPRAFLNLGNKKIEFTKANFDNNKIEANVIIKIKK